MREIKFRSWDFRNKVMDIPDNIANGIDGEKYQIMQFTGLLDRNSKEIYEGDIVDNGRVKFVVVWATEGYWYADIINGLNPTEHGTVYSYGGQYTVIGNIYEGVENDKARSNTKVGK